MGHTYTVCKNCLALNRVHKEKAVKSEAMCGKCATTLKFSSMVSAVTSEGFQKIVKKSELLVIVDFWAEWCGPCKSYGPEFEKASLINDKAVFLKVDTEKESALSQSLSIKGIPCTIIFKNGVEVKRQAGAMSADQVASLIQEVG